MDSNGKLIGAQRDANENSAESHPRTWFFESSKIEQSVTNYSSL